MKVQGIQFSSEDSNDRCPVTGRPVLRKPEWTYVSFGKNYRVSFSLIGERLLLVNTSGRATLQDRKIFLPFEQVESLLGRKYQGTGLGLPLTKNLVELHRGKIWAESRGHNSGATFRFVIPVDSSAGVLQIA